MAVERMPIDAEESSESIGFRVGELIGVVGILCVVSFGLILLVRSPKSTSGTVSIIREQGRTAQTLGIPVSANPEIYSAERRLWLDGYMEARRAHLQRMGMLKSDPDGQELEDDETEPNQDP